METQTDRRQFLKTAGGVSLGIIALGGVSGLLASCASPVVATPTPEAKSSPSPTTDVLTQVPWPYKQVDAVAAAERAYTAYYNGGCMYGAFEGIIGELRAMVGSPFDKFPATMMKYGGAGVAGWGTLCGACNGAAAAIALVCASDVSGKITSEVFGWYGQEALPNYQPRTPKFDKIPASVANSQLCHPSVTEWCNASGFKATSPERAERCAWLTASTVKYTVEQLNKNLAGGFAVVHAVPQSVTGCLSCHGKGGLKENVHATNATTCTTCHDTLTTNHPAK